MPGQNKYLDFLRHQPRWRLVVALALAALLAGLFFRGKKTAVNGTTFTVRRGPMTIKVIEGGSVEAMESQDIRSEIKGMQGTKILKIVEEGYLVTDEDVKNGKVLVELDSSDLRQRLITQDIQFQSTLAGLTEAQQSFDIQLNQNRTDVKAAEQKAKFALMDFEKFIGAQLAKDLVERLDLHEVTDTNVFDLNRVEIMLGIQPTNAVPATNSAPRGLGPALNSLTPTPSASPGQPAPAGASPPAVTAANAVLALPRAVELPEIMNLAARNTNQAMDIDFSQYADTNKLGDGAAMQQLRKLEDDLQMSQAQYTLQKTKRDGTKRLFDNGFVSKTELETEDITLANSVLKTETAKTSLALFKKYEFPKQAEELLSKYDEALRALERTRKEAVSKLAQSLAKKRAAEGKYKIEYEQLKELREQLDKCVIRAEKTGLVVYGGESERWFGGEQIREGATVRERQRIITIPDMKLMSVKIKIHESHIKKISKGLRARIRVDAYPDEELTGQVAKVGVLPDSQNRWMNPDLKVYVTTVDINEIRDWLKPGMSAKVEVWIRQLTNVVFIPLQAVSVNQGKQVCYVTGLAKPEMRTIEVGDYNDEFIEVKKGLKEGEKVLLRAPEGEQVETEEPESTAPPDTPQRERPPSAPSAGDDRASPRRERDGGSSGRSDRPPGGRSRSSGGGRPPGMPGGGSH